jgi:hypothetical protein
MNTKKKERIFESLKILIIIPYVLAMSMSDIVLMDPLEQPIVLAIWYRTFGRVSSSDAQMFIMTIESLGTILLFNILFGNRIAVYFGESRTMIFTRIPDKRLWGIGRVIGVYKDAVIYTFLMVFINFVVSAINTVGWILDRWVLMVLFFICLSWSILLTMTCILVNLLSIKHEIAISVTIVAISVLLLEYIALVFFENEHNIIFNPLCFNVDIINSTSLMFGKIAAMLTYCFIITVALICYIRNIDIL